MRTRRQQRVAARQQHAGQRVVLPALDGQQAGRRAAAPSPPRHQLPRRQRLWQRGAAAARTTQRQHQDGRLLRLRLVRQLQRRR